MDIDTAGQFKEAPDMAPLPADGNRTDSALSPDGKGRSQPAYSGARPAMMCVLRSA